MSRTLVASSDRAKLYVDHDVELGPFVSIALERPDGNAIAIGLTPGQRDQFVKALKAPVPKAPAAPEGTESK